MNKIIQILSVTALIQCLVGCAATGPLFSPEATLANDGYAKIFVYRPSRFANSAGYPQITLDGETKGGLKNGGFLIIKATPGTHTLIQEHSWKWDIRANPVVLNVQENHKYFVKLDTDASVAFMGTTPSGTMYSVTRGVYFAEVEESIGLDEIKNLHISN